jgi:hypothetical protein
VVHVVVVGIGGVLKLAIHKQRDTCTCTTEIENRTKEVVVGVLMQGALFYHHHDPHPLIMMVVMMVGVELKAEQMGMPNLANNPNSLAAPYRTLHNLSAKMSSLEEGTTSLAPSH